MVEAIKKWKREPELTFIQLNIAQGNIVPNGQSPLPGAPNVVERLREYLGSIPRGEILRRAEKVEAQAQPNGDVEAG